jgi:hypothetical protein
MLALWRGRSERGAGCHGRLRPWHRGGRHGDPRLPAHLRLALNFGIAILVGSVAFLLIRLQDAELLGMFAGILGAPAIENRYLTGRWNATHPYDD